MTDRLREKAEEIWRGHVVACLGSHAAESGVWPSLREAIHSALLSERDRTLEEVAESMEGATRVLDEDGDATFLLLLRGFVRQIRNFKSKQ